ncbi:hypothetical protein GCM10027517_19110 [Phycicoccus ginsengisoli]
MPGTEPPSPPAEAPGDHPVAGHAGTGPGDVRAVLVERGSFAHASCTVCGWLGPGRRSRKSAREDAQSHPAACPGEATTD